ncbi:MAG: RNA-binding cell elongation regulator Jag/EloR [Actinomycetota bacterium]|nr:RNA-binding cell elongation regulator Jag/EloR [Actinomycetota bacterium]MDZ4179541.1 RNA-binding cell elongation regulator Jag/EloR [Coriobacteriia bacterium]
MMKETIKEAASVPEALDAALEELGVQQDAIEYEVLEGGGKRLFGLGTERTAKVRVWLKDVFVAELEEARKAARDIVGGGDGDEPTPEARGADMGQPTPELTDEELDKVADQAVSAIQSVLAGFGIEAAVEEYEGDDGEIILDVVGDDLGVLIGRHGRTLDSIQTLVSAVTNRALGFRYPVLVDVEGYRNRRREKLEEIARRASERASRHKQPVKLRPMSSYERKVIHMYLRDDRRVTTISEGDEPFRMVVVLPK